MTIANFSGQIRFFPQWLRMEESPNQKISAWMIAHSKKTRHMPTKKHLNEIGRLSPLCRKDTNCEWKCQ